MKLFTALTSTFCLTAALSTYAAEPPAVHSCVFDKCVKTYYVCNDKTDKNCQPTLSIDQKYALDAYQLCKAVTKGNCKHPGITKKMMDRIEDVADNFNQCKQTCYQKKAPNLYKHVF